MYERVEVSSGLAKWASRLQRRWIRVSTVAGVDTDHGWLMEFGINRRQERTRRHNPQCRALARVASPTPSSSSPFEYATLRNQPNQPFSHTGELCNHRTCSPRVCE
eukprot:GHVU01225634.1.p2 GENE.GHVU01225634.1~~GHVU01225634.1.p2  ORF type:complete len:106 (-),score=5.54 GHVU01225634.1:129-446(-)